ncbi:neutral ceramidase [Cylas formicarius]|uniref:neutral ceramidase n=1 Tax=Cylas formicarius TaxID=197179 RepID=UPI0029589561|nr:neutral ceramidase [Cylas formicarius]XP_060526422.1 neutral ceramidase [Cylas formicarius]XP_060526423.1 neutral ceramidase [Cylas formicarius]XP_060526424.1 neutral ceramidase [Cylas formicarius]
MAPQKGRTVWAALLLCLSAFSGTARGVYNVGVGRADMTGPSAEITLMGYAKSTQKGCGIITRQYSRAYIFDDGTTRVLYVTIDTGMIGIGVKNLVLEQLRTLYGDTYTQQNFILSGTHTHNGPGGFLMDVLYDISIFGTCKDTVDAYVDGIVESVKRAHENVVEARIYVNKGEVLDANINRSPTSYLANPEDERNQYEHDTDKTLVQLRIDRASDGVSIAAINWYAVHPVSLNNTNCLVSSDNVGYASILLENDMDPKSLPGESSFVGAFASTNLGDVSPNTNGPRCINTGEPCDKESSSCGGENKYCIAFGPGKDMYESAEIIATKLFDKAKVLLANESSHELTGPVGFIHQFVSMRDESVTVQDPTNGSSIEVKGCYPAMGYSFAAGTIDGPGEFDFKQGTTSDNPFWNLVRDFIFPPTTEDIDCHYPKPILMGTGRMSFPYEWQPHVVATQIIRVGDFALVAVPGEFTTMSGRRLRKAVKEVLVDNGAPDSTEVVLAGLSNTYTSYIATFEEYQLQRYEAAATIFGPHTLSIYIKVYSTLAEALMKGTQVEEGPPPPDVTGQTLSLITPVIFDSAGFTHNFGDVLQQPPESAKIGDVVSAIFVSGHPRNDVMHGKTFLTVEQQTANNSWKVIANDASWETRFIWTRTGSVTGTSTAEIRWEIRDHVQPGVYRIGHFGNYKSLWGGIGSYNGTSNSFVVEA